jgi:hypothetical protein
MWSYSICGCAFQSNIPLPELVIAGGRQPQFTFHLCATTNSPSGQCSWLNDWYSTDGSVWLAFGKIDAGYLLRFPDLGDYVVSTDASSIRCYPGAEMPLETIRHLLLNQVIPIVLSQLGEVVLHASACATPQGAIAFLGNTGAGKSTLAASFALRGFPLITDDCLLLEEQSGAVVAIPSYPGLRLWPESIAEFFEQEPVLQPVAHYTEKKRLFIEQDYFGDPSLLSAIYILAEPQDTEGSSDVAISPVTASEAIFEAIKHTFQLDVTDYNRLARDFRRYEWLAKSVPFFRLAFPREHASLYAVHVAILDHLELIQKRQ